MSSAQPRAGRGPSGTARIGRFTVRTPVLAGIAAIVVVLGLGAWYAATYGKAQQVEFVVIFHAGATVAQQDAARQHCPTTGKVIQEPAGSSKLATNRAYPLRYDITDAGPADQAALLRCLTGQPGVQAVNQQRQGD